MLFSRLVACHTLRPACRSFLSIRRASSQSFHLPGFSGFVSLRARSQDSLRKVKVERSAKKKTRARGQSRVRGHDAHTATSRPIQRIKRASKGRLERLVYSTSRLASERGGPAETGLTAGLGGFRKLSRVHSIVSGTSPGFLVTYTREGSQEGVKTSQARLPGRHEKTLLWLWQTTRIITEMEMAVTWLVFAERGTAVVAPPGRTYSTTTR
jgi:hypothetical protein